MNNSKCAIHNRRDDMFCQDCEKSVCAECAVMSDHRKHTICMKDNIQKNHKQFIHQTEKTLANLDSSLMLNIDKKEQLLRDQKNNIVYQIEDQYSTLQEKVKYQKTQSLEELNKMFKEEFQNISVIKNNIEEIKSLLEQSKNEKISFNNQIKNKKEISRLLDTLIHKKNEVIETQPGLNITVKVEINFSSLKIYMI